MFLGTGLGTNVDGVFPPWNFNVCLICTGVTYTNPQVREEPDFSLESAGFKGRDCPLGFRKNRKMRFKTAKNRNSNPRDYHSALSRIALKGYFYLLL